MKSTISWHRSSIFELSALVTRIRTSELVLVIVITLVITLKPLSGIGSAFLERLTLRRRLSVEISAIKEHFWKKLQASWKQWCKWKMFCNLNLSFCSKEIWGWEWNSRWPQALLLTNVCPLLLFFSLQPSACSVLCSLLCSSRNRPADPGSKSSHWGAGSLQHFPVHVLLHTDEKNEHRQHVGGSCRWCHSAYHGLDCSDRQPWCWWV